MSDTKDSKFKLFLNKAKGVLPELGNVVGKLATGNYIGAIADVGGILTGKANSNDKDSSKAKELLAEFELRKIEFALEEQKLEFQDKADAREMYKEDNGLQKVFAITFLSCYILLTILMLYGFYQVAINEVKIQNYVVAFVTSVYTGMSMKVNTIVEFLFGSSLSINKK
jgi:hypothetical protein